MRAQPEEVLFREGQRNGDFFVVLAGNVAVVEARGTPEERTIAVHGRRRFLGELGLLTGEASYFTAVAVVAGEVLAVPVERLRELVARDPGLGDLILRAYLVRRSILIGLGVGLRIVGSPVLAGRQAAPRLRGAQPASIPLGGPGGRPGRRDTAPAFRRGAGGHPDRDRGRPAAPQRRPGARTCGARLLDLAWPGSLPGWDHR